jgi:phosphoglycolate phosphatase-like HAD superfamily hydrolase
VSLAVFDIDGTLTDTNAVDTHCYFQALADRFGLTDVDSDWAGYPHATDSAVLAHVLLARRGRAPSREEVRGFRNRFAALLAEAPANAFQPIPGARDLLRALLAGRTTAVALASGGWPESAALKLKRSGLACFDLPGAYAADAESREEILVLALDRARERYGRSFRSIVYVGDGVWDARACRTLGLPFVGVGTGEAAARLRAEGAICVVSDLTATETLVSVLERGRRPSNRRGSGPSGRGS